MVLIPASKPDAAHVVSKTLSEVLFWSQYPDPEPLSGDWWETQKQRIDDVVESARRSFADDPVVTSKLQSVRSLGYEFVGLLFHCPELAKAPARNWTSESERRLFDDLGNLQRFFRDWPTLSDDVPDFLSSPVALPDGTLRTTTGDFVQRDELTEEDRSSSEWAAICEISDDTFRNRMYANRPGATWRIVESGSQRYRVHVEDLPSTLRGSKKQRDEHLKSAPK